MDPKTGLYSKAAKIIRSLPQERGTAEQMIAAARKMGVKPAELEGDLPTGKIDREALAQHFEQRVPKLRIEQYGENPPYLQGSEMTRYRELANRLGRHESVSDAEREEYRRMHQRYGKSPSVIEDEEDEGVPAPTSYEDYKLPGGRDYRERLIKAPQVGHDRRLYQVHTSDGLPSQDYETVEQARAAAEQWQRENPDGRAIPIGPIKRPNPNNYQSGHWRGHPNVIAHIRLQDRTVGPTGSFAEAKQWAMPVVQKIADHMGATPADLGSGAAKYAVQNGLITPEEAATLTQIKGWQNEFSGKKVIGKRLLHVEELQSDWAQEGRDKGFYDPQKPFQLYDWDKNKPISSHASEDEAVAAGNALGEDATVSVRRMNTGKPDMPPVGPYVQNTQHWTDLALKNVLREAALGNYDGIVFTPGQAQADRYGLEKQLDILQYSPSQKRLIGYKNGDQRVVRDGVEQNDLHGLIGKDIADRLLHPDSMIDPSGGNPFHEIRGGDLKMGGQGMKGYYDQIVPKSAMKLAQMHDPSAQPGQPVPLKGDDGEEYQGFHLPMTDKLKQGILNEGFPAYRRGGSIGAALAVTRRFTKDGKAAMMRLNGKGA